MLQEREGLWRMMFTFRGERHFLSLGRLTREQAELRVAEARALLARVRRGELELPEGMNIATFLTFGGVVPGDYRRPGESVRPAEQDEASEEVGRRGMTNDEFQAMLDEPSEETIEWLSRYQRDCRRAWDKIVIGKLIELLSAHIAAGPNG